jgi:predicted PurR-regulated permease PerM
MLVGAAAAWTLRYDLSMADAPPSVGLGVRVLLVVAATVVIVAGLRAAQAVLVPFMVSVFLSILCVPLVQTLRRWHVPTPVAVLAVVLMVMVVLGGVAALVGNSVNRFASEIDTYQRGFLDQAEGALTWLESHGVEISRQTALGAVDPGELLRLVSGTVKGLASALSNTVLVILTMVFILLEAAGFPVKLRAAMGGKDSKVGRFAKVTREVQRYLMIKTVVSLVTGALITGWVALLGVDFPLLWGLVAFLLNYVPSLGSIIAAVPAVLLAVLQFGPGRALIVAVGYLTVNTIIGNLVEPQLMGRRLGLSTLVVFLSLIFWGWVWGPVGMLLSVPMTVIVKIFLENTEDLRWVAVLLDSSRVVEATMEMETVGDRAP